jgi:hypothetical protein
VSGENSTKFIWIVIIFKKLIFKNFHAKKEGTRIFSRAHPCNLHNKSERASAPYMRGDIKKYTKRSCAKNAAAAAAALFAVLCTLRVVKLWQF